MSTSVKSFARVCALTMVMSSSSWAHTTNEVVTILTGRWEHTAREHKGKHLNVLGYAKTDVVAAVNAALSRKKEVFQFVGQPVVIRERESAILRVGTKPDAPFVKRKVPVIANHVSLIEPMEKAFAWWGRRKARGVWVVERQRMDDWIVNAIVRNEGKDLPVLAGVADFPVFWDNDLIMGHIGYHKETRLYIDSEELEIEPDQFKSPQDAFTYNTKFLWHPFTGWLSGAATSR